MQLSVKSVFSAADGAVGGGTIILFVLTTALDSMRAANDKYVRETRVTRTIIVEYPRAYHIWHKAVNTRTRIITLYRHIHRMDIFTVYALIISM